MADLTATAPLLTDRLQRAFALASEVHATQVRKGRCIPHLAHLMSVAARALEHGCGENAAIGGLLHDAVGDASDGTQTEARIRRQFGDRVADIVIACSDAVAVSGRPETAMAIARRSTSGTCRETDHAVLLVSACDKLHNARTIVADLRAIGPALWDRFNEKDPAPQLWYYKSLADCYRGRVPAGAVR